ncbi:type II toxin-antitoxin system VapC family toxin [Halovivax gelatinilyticus]|uniref:type II toxin-antitoxin system VapC family toxin n=1 Tax=Halovivax gelatinilyticus TaxID=2961597 RepID=UPI0020CA5B4D|nr:type II toxin-antitoxin system VapC family toxin [Halovivax gelatinilyticus]
MILDTSFLIDLMHGDDDAVEMAETIESDLRQQRVSSMTLFELYYGVARSTRSDAERKRIETVLDSKPVQPADSAVMRKAGRLAGELMNEGNAVDDSDVVIGATAAMLDEPVLTRNVDDFERIPGVDVETY